MSRPARTRVHRGKQELGGEDGQSLIFVAICLLVMIGFLGLTIDVGRLYITQRHLQTAADAAALAAAQDLPNGTTALQTACAYSATASSTGGTCTGFAGT